jgi:hypothetical protein
MPLAMPSLIRTLGIVDEPIRHEWDDSIKQDVLLDQPGLRKELSATTDRGVLAFSLGSTEWIVWRLSRHLSDGIPFLVIEAAWAGIVDWRYLKSLDVPDWSETMPRPIGGPLELAFWLLRHAFIAAREGEPGWDYAASLSELTSRVLNRPESFKEWRDFVIDRLRHTHPVQKDNVLGAPVPREALDAGFDYQPSMASQLLSRFLASLDPAANPYLRSSEEMLAAGFQGKPYSL